MRPLTTRSYGRLLIISDASFELKGDQARLYEPLAEAVPITAIPLVIGAQTVHFYDQLRAESAGPDASVRPRLLGTATFRNLSGPPVTAVRLDSDSGRSSAWPWFEVLCGNVVVRDGEWCMEWRCSRSTRMASMLNHGYNPR